MAVYELNVSYEIKCNNKFSWSYVYVDDGRTCEIWADSIEALKEKVKNEFLPWDDNKIPKEKEIPKVKKHTPRDDTPYRVSGTWVKSIYKQYD